MPHPFTLFTGQWADLPLEEVCRHAREWGYDGLELACWGDHFEVSRALSEGGYLPGRHELLAKYDLKCWAISNHLVGQAVCDHPIDARHQAILPARIWGDGEPEGVRQRAAAEMADTARAAAAFGVDTVVGFTGSSIWHTLQKGKKRNLTHSGMFLDFLAGNQEFHCTPWGMPTRNVFGWQKPCYLLGEGYAKTFKELMETTDWDAYGTGRYEKCANCMAHCGYEPTAANATLKHPLKALAIALGGVKTEGPMAPEISLADQRPAKYVFDSQVQLRLSEIRANEAREKAAKAAAKTSASAA